MPLKGYKFPKEALKNMLVANKRIAEKVNPFHKFGFSYHKYEKRWFVVCRIHHHENFARIVMRNSIGRELSSKEQVHHIDYDSQNDNIENLLIVSRAEHRRIHNIGNTFSLETRKKMSISRLGRKHTPESRRKMSIIALEKKSFKRFANIKDKK